MENAHTKLKQFDLFAGYGGFTIAGERCGLETVGFSEIDKYANAVLKYHYPLIPNFYDITKIEWDKVPDFDLLTGGSPCQDLSIAGKRAGLEGKRSGLFYEYMRAVREKKPKYFIWENVKGALSSNQGRDFAIVLNEMAEAGYSLWWQVLNAKDFGVPQNRERIFVIGFRDRPAPEVFFERCQSAEDTRAMGQEISYTIDASYAKGTNTLEKSRRQVIKQLNNPTHSNDRVYAEDGLSPCLNTAQGGNRQPFIAIPEATKQGYAIAEEGDSINLSQPNSTTRRGRVGKDIANTLDCGMQQYTLVDTNKELEYNGSINNNTNHYDSTKERRPDKEVSSMRETINTQEIQRKDGGLGAVSSEEILRLGVPQGDNAEQMETGRSVEGRKLSCDSIISEDRDLREMLAKKENGNPSQERRQDGQQNGESNGDLPRLPYDSTSNGSEKEQLEKPQTGQAGSFRIRRLTPCEAERLMGLSDGWTAKGVMNDKEIEISDSQRYKLCGNGVVVNVVEKLIINFFN